MADPLPIVERIEIFPNPAGIRSVMNTSTLEQRLCAGLDPKFQIERISRIDPLTPLSRRDWYLYLFPWCWQLLYYRKRYPNRFVITWLRPMRKFAKHRYSVCDDEGRLFETKQRAEQYELQCVKTWLVQHWNVLD